MSTYSGGWSWWLRYSSRRTFFSNISCLSTSESHEWLRYSTNRLKYLHKERNTWMAFAVLENRSKLWLKKKQLNVVWYVYVYWWANQKERWVGWRRAHMASITSFYIFNFKLCQVDRERLVHEWKYWYLRQRN